MSAHDTAALRALLRATAPDLLGYFARRVSSREDAADLYGETMLTVWKRIATMPSEAEHQRRWLFVVAAHTLSNHRRSCRRRQDLTGRLRALVTAAPTTPDTQEAVAVRDAVLRLDDVHRELVMLVHWEGFTLVDAAEILGLNPSTARSRYAAARTTLRETLADAPH